MKIEENLLHYIWSLIQYQDFQLKTTSGQIVKVVSPGTLNLNRGPDFKEAKLQIGEQIWAGSVEIHVKASHWLAHKHQNDPNYQSVILHVVYEADQAISFSSQELIPTVELRQFISLSQLETFRSLKSNELGLPCDKLFHQVEPVYAANMLHKAAIERLGQKAQELIRQVNAVSIDWNELFYHLLAKNFGFKQNAEPMLALAKSLPVRVLAKHKDNPLEIEALFFGQAGFLQGQVLDSYQKELIETYSFLRVKYALEPIAAPNWRLMKTRPANYPTVRVSQFAHLICNASHLFSKVLEIRVIPNLIDLFKASANEYWQYHLYFNQTRKKKREVSLGSNSLHLILINTVSTALFAYGEYCGNEEMKHRAVNLMMAIPCEKNRVTKKYQSHGFVLQSALDSQGVLGLEKSYCTQKKCLDCLVGKRLLGNLN